MTSEVANSPRDASAAPASVRHPNRPKRYLTRRAQGKRYGKAKRTIDRWGRDPKIGMPPEYWFNGVPHRAEDELETWEAQRRGKRI
jgi:hypothetical protein